MPQENILDLNDKMNSLLFFFKGGGGITDSVNRDEFLVDLDFSEKYLSSEILRLKGKIPIIMKSSNVGSVTGFKDNFNKRLKIYLSTMFKVNRAMEIIKGLEVEEIEIPQYVANYYKNVGTI